MELQTGNKSAKPMNINQQTNQRENPVSSSSSSSSFSDSLSDGQIVFQVSQSSISNSVVHSHPSSSSSSSARQNQLIGIPGYDPNRIPSSVFTAKPTATNSTEWSLASSDSLFSIHAGNTGVSMDFGLAAMSNMGETPKFDEPINQKNNTYLVPPSVKKLKEPETAQNVKQKEEPESESDDEKEEELVEIDNKPKPEILPQTAKDVDDVTTEDVRHSISLSCHSDTSNHSSSSFAFPVLENDDEGVKIQKIDSKRLLEKINSQKPQLRPSEPKEKEPPRLPQPQWRPELETQLRPHSLLGVLIQPQPCPQLETHKQPQPRQQRQPQTEKEWAEMAREGQRQMQTPKASENGWFSCFFCCSVGR